MKYITRVLNAADLSASEPAGISWYIGTIFFHAFRVTEGLNVDD